MTTTYTTSTGKQIKVTANKSAKTFTIRTTSGKYRTLPVTKSEFENMAYNTGADWQQFLISSNAYYPVK